MSDLTLAMRIALKNELSGPMKAALRDVRAVAKELETGLKGVNTEAQRSGASLSSAFSSAANPLQGVNSQLMSTRALLREIALGAGRATRDLGRMPAGNALRGGMAVARGANMAFQGVQTGNLALQYQLAKPIDYELKLAHLANTAFPERDTLGRKQGAGELNTAIMHAVRVGKGSRDQAAEALDTMIASGALTLDESKALLPTIVKGATATGADANQLANIAIRGKQSFGISAAQLPRLLDMAVTAGQAGGFELKDMAKWLPEQMAAGRMSGMKGIGDFGRLLALNQLSVMTAGTKDAAGNNLVNLLAKINSQDTSNDAKKLGIDLSGTLAKARLQGIDPMTAFMALIDREGSKDKTYVALRQKAADAKTPDERRAAYESAADILEGKSIGKLIQDRQALMMAIAYRNNGGQLDALMPRIMNGEGAVGKNFDLISGTYSSKRTALEAEQEGAKTNLFGSLSGPMGTLTERTVELYQKYPALGEAMEGLKIGANTAAAALAAVGVTGLLTGGGALAGGTAAGAGGLAAALGVAKAGALGLGGVGVAAGGGALLGYGLYRYGLQDNAGGDAIGYGVARTMALLGSGEARRAIEITNKIMLDGRQIAEANNLVNARANRRD